MAAHSFLCPGLHSQLPHRKGAHARLWVRCHNQQPTAHSNTKPQTKICRRQILKSFEFLSIGLWFSSHSASAQEEVVTADVAPEIAAVPPPQLVRVAPQPSGQVYILNQRVQAQNRAPDDFPVFVREGYNIKVVADGYNVTPEGVIYKEFTKGEGSSPTEGQQVEFNYVAYNESASLIDSSYRQRKPAVTRIGINGLIPGFEIALRQMKPGARWRIVVPPELGPPVGPATFFSAKQSEVFDVELLGMKTCVRRQVMMFSDIVCE